MSMYSAENVLDCFSTEALVKELEKRNDVLFVKAYTKQTIKDGFDIVGKSDMATRENIDTVFNAISKDKLNDTFNEWEVSDGSDYDYIIDAVNSFIN